MLFGHKTAECLTRNKRLTVLDLSGNPDVPVIKLRAVEERMLANRGVDSKNRQNERRERFAMHAEEFATRQYMMQVLAVFCWRWRNCALETGCCYRKCVGFALLTWVLTRSKQLNGACLYQKQTLSVSGCVDSSTLTHYFDRLKPGGLKSKPWRIPI